VGESPPECAAYCFRVVKPCLSYLDVLQNRVNAYESVVPSDILARVSLTDTKMDILGRQLAVLQEKEKDYQKKIIKLEDRLAKGVPSHFGNFQKLGQKYYYVEKELRETWHGAVKKCHEMGGFLVSLQSQQEIDAISGKLKEYSRYWIDVTDQFKEGEYVSISSGLGTTFLKWDEHEPSGNGEQCVEIHTYKEPPVMNDNVCSNKKYFICESSTEVDD
ncbi:hypothetical protein KR067_009917, partial [Drosophila pandora]